MTDWDRRHSVADEVREALESGGHPVERVPWTKRVVEHLKGFRDWEVEYNTAKAAEQLRQDSPPAAVESVAAVLRRQLSGGSDAGLLEALPPTGADKPVREEAAAALHDFRTNERKK